jgi:hypothetical protein
MNRLQLCQRARAEMGLGGSGPTTTIAQTGEMLQVVNWVDTAWERIQSMRNWDWLWETATVTVLANTSALAGTIPDKRYVKDGVRNPDGAELTYMPWAAFRLAYPSTFIVAGTPSVWTIRPDKAFQVNAKPASNTAFSVERYKNPTVMTTDSDATTGTPQGIPSEHHMLIVWRAVMLYAGHDEAQVLYNHAQAEYKKVLAAMGATDAPAIHWGASW